jgi:hypothetical protein
MDIASPQHSHACYLEKVAGFLGKLWPLPSRLLCITLCLPLPLWWQQLPFLAMLSVFRSFLVFIYKLTLICWSQKDERA